MLHHVSIGVSDLARSAAFYDAVLGALGYGRFMEKAGTVSWRPDGGASPADRLAPQQVVRQGHVAPSGVKQREQA